MPLTIGQLARRAGVHLETIRYYERRRLLPRPPRTPSGYRQYAPDSVERLRFIKRAQALGFTLEEIRGLLELRLEKPSGQACAAVEARAEEKIAVIDRKLAELSAMRRRLESLVAKCRAREPSGDCPVLERLDEEEKAGMHV